MLSSAVRLSGSSGDQGVKGVKDKGLTWVSVSLVLCCKEEHGRLSNTQSFAWGGGEMKYYDSHLCPSISVISLSMKVKSTWPKYFTLGPISQHCYV